MSTNTANPKKLPGLNALRAIAASIVLVGHVYQLLDITDMTDRDLGNYHSAGGDMVNLFFVLSGFIITYILLHEKQRTGDVSLKNFYFKRILRIWPIYFLIFFLVVALQYFTNFYGKFEPLTMGSFWTYLFFAVNINQIFFHVGVSVLPHYWSLSVEEQFYLYWPFVIKKLNVVGFSVAMILVWIIARNTFAYLASHGAGDIFYKLNELMFNTRFPSMAMGAIGAYAVVNGKPWFNYFISSTSKTVLLTVLIAGVLLRPILYIPYVHFEFFAVIYLLLILNVIHNSPKNITESKIINETGVISYGIYMYQWPLIPIIFIGVKKLGLTSLLSSFNFIPMVLLCYGIIWGISYISFYYFEMYFLKIKDRKKPVLQEVTVRAGS